MHLECDLTFGDSRQAESVGHVVLGKVGLRLVEDAAQGRGQEGELQERGHLHKQAEGVSVRYTPRSIHYGLFRLTALLV